MELQFLGTGAGVPAKMRNVSSIALKLLDERNEIWLFDCGEATQQQILNTTIRPGKIKKIFITHLHGDHIFGLPGLLTSRSFQGGEDELTVYGPKGIKRFIDASVSVSYSKLGYPLKVVEFEEDGVLFSDKQFSVEAMKLEHGIPSYGFRITEADQIGELKADELKALGVPFGPIFGRLKRGEVVALEDGRVIDGKDFVSEDIKGRVVVICGDTRFTPKTITLAENANVLVHEATYEADKEKTARQHFHSTSKQAATIALEASVQQLYLTHISARYLGHQVSQLEQEARQVFPQTKVVKDFDIFTIGRN
ncbi:ribonuclease Z [Granulicatella elegans]|uniref:ribonuclease Z n=1 Tax=Granulicatella elegans TaxID=137732 RepID=UPI001D137069|nr:ribonuclease Z [Granulicatella elegans]UEA31297.1 ribonuclease Z [Granulicatella elegans]